MNVTENLIENKNPVDINPSLQNSIYTLIFWGGIFCIIIIFITFVIHAMRNNIYEELFKNEIPDQNINELKKELNKYFDDCNNYNKKLITYGKANRIRHYISNFMITYCMMYIGYMISRYFYFYNISVGIEITFYIITLLELITLILSITFIQSKNINTIDPEKDNVCLVIPFGGTKIEEKVKTLEKVTNDAKKIFPLKNIYLIHNGKSKIPDQTIVDKCKSFGVNYFYIPVPSKSYALYYASNYIIKKEFSVMMIDDDVLLPNNLIIPAFEYDGINVDIWAHMICAEKPDNNSSYFQKMIIYCQDIEYRFAGFMKQFQSAGRTATLLSHHGAISLYKNKVLQDVMSNHDGVFDGEDYLMGIIAYNRGDRMKIVSSQYVPTKTPDNIIDFYKQRVYSWDYVNLKFVKHHFRILLNFRNFDLIMKLNIFYNLWTVFQDLVRLPNILLMVFLRFNYTWLVTYLCLATILKSIGIIFVLYFKNKMAHLKIKYGLSLLVIYPIYNLFCYFLRLIAMLRFIFYYENKVCYDIKLKDRPQFPNILKYYKNIDDINWQEIYLSNNNIIPAIEFNQINIGISDTQSIQKTDIVIETSSELEEYRGSPILQI